MSELKAQHLAVALSSKGTLGIIIGDEQQDVVYPSGETGTSWQGFVLLPTSLVIEDEKKLIIAESGSPWYSTQPKVLCHLTEDEVVEDTEDGSKGINLGKALAVFAEKTGFEYFYPQFQAPTAEESEEVNSTEDSE